MLLICLLFALLVVSQVWDSPLRIGGFLVASNGEHISHTAGAGGGPHHPGGGVPDGDGAHHRKLARLDQCRTVKKHRDTHCSLHRSHGGGWSTASLGSGGKDNGDEGPRIDGDRHSSGSNGGRHDGAGGLESIAWVTGTGGNSDSSGSGNADGSGSSGEQGSGGKGDGSGGPGDQGSGGGGGQNTAGNGGQNPGGEGSGKGPDFGGSGPGGCSINNPTACNPGGGDGPECSGVCGPAIVGPSQVTPVPEPASLFLVGGGMIALLKRRGRRETRKEA